ncbi:transcriptional activator NhaR [Saccharophagus degradans]|uniref:Transcriptional activator NhaR n=2 Tax=Saccharophagus degradans TaxID=86304 RepID=A0AAW7X7G2_9GAMM|nr:transcriptional activator NhaR [Saccharophagus degradans]MDO6422443.1 transcriptional activator NhaR [Saccharophagus degradans]MDO6608017.1 transcriptional activator NhaR [Saccharophagus degradans]
MINYKQLYYFWAVAKHGGITRASEQLHLTPQTISGQLSELEKGFEATLFDRVGRRLELTALGKLAYSYADEIFQVGKELENAITKKNNIRERVFRVGISSSVPKSIAYKLLSPALEKDPGIHLVCKDNNLEHLFADLALHKTDLVIADKPLSSDVGIKGYNHLLGECPIAFYATPALAERYRPNFPHSLNNAPLLLPGEDSALRIMLQRWLSQQSINPIVKGEFDDTALMKAFAQEGVGIFPGPTVIDKESQKEHGVEMLGEITELKIRYYAISAERKLRHPSVVAISEAAQQNLFAPHQAARNIDTDGHQDI